MLEPYLGPRRQSRSGPFEFDSNDLAMLDQIQLPSQWKDSLRAKQWYEISPEQIYWCTDRELRAIAPLTETEMAQVRAQTGGCFWYLKLPEQCRLLGFCHQEMKKSDLQGMAKPQEDQRNPAVEDLALNPFRSSNYAIDRSEGAAFFLLAYAVRELADPLPPVRYNEYGPVRCYKWWSVEEFDRFMPLLTLEHVRPLYDYWKTTPNCSQWTPGATSNLSWHFVEALMNPSLQGTVQTLLRNRFQRWNGFGWPDLTLINDGSLEFIEVKAKGDRFTLRQVDWARAFIRPLGLQAQVWRVL